MCSVKKVFKEISQNSQENICDRVSFLIKLQPEPATLFKKRLWHRCFPVNFAKFLRTPFLTEHLQWLLLSNAQPINQSVMWAHVFMLLISAAWLTNHLTVLACQQSSNLNSRCIIYCF